MLESAIANAEHNDGADIDELKVKTIYVEQGAIAEALHGARQGPRQSHQQADLPHLRDCRQLRSSTMGQKIHPTGFRLAVTRNWASRWYASTRTSPTMLAEDLKVREYLKKKLKNASVRAS